VNWDTNQASAALNVKRKKLFRFFAYYGSFFHNNTETMIWADPANAGLHAGLAEEPSNQFNQFTLTAATNSRRLPSLWPLVRLAAEPRTSHSFTHPSLEMDSCIRAAAPLPRRSCVYRLASAKFTAKHKKWEFRGDFRFDDRDNQTPRRPLSVPG
jgi:hypothetical protein